MVASILAATAVGVLELSLGNPGAAHRQLGPLGRAARAGRGP